MNERLFGVVILVLLVPFVWGLVLVVRRNLARLAEWRGDRRITCAECGYDFWALEAHLTSDGDSCCSQKCRFFKEIEKGRRD